MENTSYEYNGLGQRVKQTVSAVATDYLLDVQPGLWKVIGSTTGGNTAHYIHDGISGLHSQQDHLGEWAFTANDHLGSVRAVYDDALNEDYFTQYAPYGDPFSSVGSNPTPYGFTGEPTDSNGLVHLRARYYNPGLGNFTSLDPLETTNRYAYVSDNPINSADPMGLQESDPRVGTCDRYSEPWKSACITGIRLRAQSIMTGGYALREVFSDMMYHYFYGENLNQIRKRPLYFDPEPIVNDQGFMQNLNLVLLQKFKQEAAFYRPQIGQTLCSTPGIMIPPLDVTISPWEERNIRFPDGTELFTTFGGSAIRTYNTTARVEFQQVNDLMIVTIRQQLEFYDFYDWCGVDNTCQPDAIDVGLLQGEPETGGLGTPDHPLGLYVGDFTSLEKAGLADPFDIYSSWIQTTTFAIPNDCCDPSPPNWDEAYLWSSDTQSIAGFTNTQPRPLTSPIFYQPQSRGYIGDLEENGYQPSRLFAPDQRETNWDN